MDDSKDVAPASGRTPVAPRLLVVLLTTMGIMFAFEWIKEWILPELPKWNSHFLTILFSAAMVTLVAYILLWSWQGLRKTISQLDQEKDAAQKGTHRLEQLIAALQAESKERSRETEVRLKAVGVLEESEARFRQMAENLAVVFFMVDAALTRTFYVSPAFERITGYASAEAYENPRIYVDFIHEEDLPFVEEKLADLSRRPVEVDYRIRRKDGLILWCRTCTYPVRPEGGEVERVVGITEDITESKTAEEKLRKSEAFLNMSQQVAKIGSWEWELSGTDVYWSREMYRIFGRDPETFTPQLDKIIDLFHEDDREGIRAGIERSMKQNEEEPAKDLRAILPDGRERIVSGNGLIVRDKEGRPVKMIGVVMDLDERRRLERQLLHSQKLESIGRLAGGVAHDFNNLLTSILGHVALARRALGGHSPGDRHLDVIQLAAERSADLTGQLLAFARQQMVRPRRVSINHSMIEADHLVRRAIGENIEIEIIPMEGLGDVQIDPGQLSQILVNLVVNARDAMPDGGKLTIETGHVMLDEVYARQNREVVPGPYVMLAVSDTGVGIPEGIRDHIFEPFFTTKEVGQGTGLGLATCYGIAKQNGGHISVYSEVGKGTTFKIYFPRMRDGPEVVSEVTYAEPSGGQETILLAEDDELLRNLGFEYLSNKGYRVLKAEDGRRALEIAEHHDGEIHLLIADVVMPQLGGPELAQAIVNRCPRIKTLFVTGYSENAAIRNGTLAAGVEVLQKPFAQAELASRVRALLDTPVEMREG